MTRINVAIAVADEAHYRLYEVATICRALGFGHTATLSDVGILKGSAELEDLPALRAVPGVRAIEMEEPREESRGTRRTLELRVRRGVMRRVRRVVPASTGQ